MAQQQINQTLLAAPKMGTGMAKAEADDSTLLIAKIVAMVVLLVITMLCGAIPFALNRYYKWNSTNAQSPRSAAAVKCLLYFGGGVLLCTTFLHLLPEVQEVCEDLKACNMIPNLPFSLPELLMCCGFFLMYLLEEMIHTYMHHRQQNSLRKNKDAVMAFERGHSVRKSVLLQTTNKQRCDDDTAASYFASDSTLAATNDSKECIIVASNISYPVNDLQTYSEAKNHANHGHSHVHLPADDDSDGAGAPSLRGLLLVLALSLHELFEGLAIGLEDAPSAVWFTFGAVSAHKLVLAFCVGMELVIARTRTLLSVIYVITFSIVSPIGIAIGIAVSLHADDSEPSLASALLQGIACGTLLYVVFFEILTKNHAGWWAYLSLSIGFMLMFGLQILGEEADSQSDSGYSCATKE